MIKKYRLYFNRKEDFPCLWSIDEGSAASEIRVQGIVLTGVGLAWTECHKGLIAPAGCDVNNEPSAWIELHARLTIENGFATFTSGVFE